MFGKIKLKTRKIALVELLRENREAAEAWATDDFGFFPPPPTLVPDSSDPDRIVMTVEAISATVWTRTVWTKSLAKWVVQILETIDSPEGSKSLDTATEFVQELEDYPDACHPWIAEVLRDVLEAGEADLLPPTDPGTQELPPVRGAVSYFCTLVTNQGIKSAVAECASNGNSGEWPRAATNAKLALNLSPALAPYCDPQAPILALHAHLVSWYSLAIAKSDPTNPAALKGLDVCDMWIADARGRAADMKSEDTQRYIEQIETEAKRMRVVVEGLVNDAGTG